MKITSIKAFPLQIPMRIPYRTALSERSVCDSVVAVVQTDSGLGGIGQASTSAPRYSPFEETLQGIVHTVTELIAPALVGENPMAIGSVHRIMDRVAHGHNYAHTAIDIALYDLLGKVSSAPICTILGGSVRKNLPLTAPHLGYLGPAEMSKTAEQFVKQGFRAINLRAGRDLKEDVENLKAIRQAVGNDIIIDMDFSQSLSLHQGRPDTAVNYIKSLEAFGVASFEQPLAAWDLEGMARVAAAIDTPIVADESVFTPFDAMRVIRLQAADVIKLKIIKTGGFYKAMQIAAITSACGIPLTVGHGIAGTIQNAAELHLASVLDYWKPPGEMVGFLRLESDPATGLICQNGMLQVPEDPGLGVKIDLQKYIQ